MNNWMVKFVTAASISLFSISAFAEDSLTDQVSQLLAELQETPASPATSAGSPTAYGASGGDVFFGLSGTPYTQTNSDVDGSAVLGFGLGDPYHSVGLEVSSAIISINTDDGGFGEDGNMNFKMSRFLSETFAVAIGAENAYPWGNAQDLKTSYYAVMSEQFALTPDQEFELPMTLSLGFGTASFRSDAVDDDDLSETNGAFGSVAFQIFRPMTYIIDWTGEMLNTGFSYVPMSDLPLVASVTVTDLTNRTGNRTPVVLSLGYSHNF